MREILRKPTDGGASPLHGALRRFPAPQLGPMLPVSMGGVRMSPKATLEARHIAGDLINVQPCRIIATMIIRVAHGKGGCL